MRSKKNVLQLIKDIVEKSAAIINPQKVILFGSYAYGKPGKNSDVDGLLDLA